MRIYKTIPALAAALSLPAAVFAETPAPAAGKVSFDPALTGFVSLMIILLFAIGVLAYVLHNLVACYRDKLRQQRQSGIIKTLVLIVLLTPAGRMVAAAQDTAAEAPAAPPAMIAGLPAETFYLLTGIIGFEILVLLALVLLIRIMTRLIMARPQAAQAPGAMPVVAAAKRVSFWDRFNKAVTVEREADIMLDHDYDGIRELDNSLPPWWKYGFYLTIVIGVVYLWYYHGGGKGPSSYDEYAAEVKAGEEARAAYLARSADNVDEHSVQMGDAASIAAGATIFKNNCAACHAGDGGGGVGPNLTDDYWLHGGSIRDVFASIKYGWPDKGMKSWKSDFSPKQIADLASFVRSLKGSNPAAPKEQQGTLYTEEPAGGAAADTSVSTALR